MFSALSQGSLIHILDKTDGLKYKIGEVIGVTQPKPYSAYSAPSFNNSNIVIKVKIGDTIQEFPEVPSHLSVCSYNNNTCVISETKEGLQTEVENVLQNSKQHIENVPIYEQNIKDCETILKQLSPTFAKDKERDDRINGLDEKVTSMESKLDKILNVLNKQN